MTGWHIQSLLILTWTVFSFCCGCKKADCHGLDIKEVGFPFVYYEVLQSDNVKQLSALISKGLKVNNLYSLYGNCSADEVQDSIKYETLLMLACAAGATNCIVKLIDMGADLSQITPTGRSILHYARSLPEPSARWIAELALSSGIQDVDVEDNQGRTPLWYALKCGNVVFADWLVARGAKFDRWSSDKRGIRHHYIVDAMRFPMCSFNYVAEHFCDDCVSCALLSDMLLSVDLSNEDSLYRVKTIVGLGGGMSDVTLGDHLIDQWLLVYDRRKPHLRNLMIQFLQNGLRKECVVKGSGKSIGEGKDVLEQCLRDFQKDFSSSVSNDQDAK